MTTRVKYYFFSILSWLYAHDLLLRQNSSMLDNLMTYYADNNNGPKQYKTEIFYFIDTKTKKGKAETKQL